MSGKLPLFIRRVRIVGAALACTLLLVSVSLGGLANTKHNLAANGGQATYSTDNSSTACGFCHVAHGVNADADKYAPLWSRSVNTSFSLYGGGTTMEGLVIHAPGAASLMCLACHDGTIALGAVIKYGTNTAITVVSSIPGLLTADGKFSSSYVDATNGYRPYIGDELADDHPVGFQFPDAGYGTGGGVAGIGLQPQGGSRKELTGDLTGSRYPLYPTGVGTNSFECASCHDPHTEVPKFLRSPSKDFCQDCHNRK